MLVQALREGLCKAVCQGFQEDVRVIVFRILEPRGMRLDPMDSHREPTNPVTCRVDKVGKAHIRTVAALLHLLAQEGQRDMLFLVREVDRHIIAIARARPKSGHALRREPFFRDDPVEHRIRVSLEAACALANDFVIEDSRKIPVQFPCAEERRPVDVFSEVLQRPVIEHVQSRFQRRRRLVRHVCVVEIGPRLSQR